MSLPRCALVAAAAGWGCVTPVEFGEDVALIGYWKLDETAGPTAADSSGLGNHGAYEGGPLPSELVPSVSFANPRSLSFGPAKNVVVPDSATLRLTGPLTLAAWVRPARENTMTQQGIIEKWEIDLATNRVARGYEFRLSYEREIRMVLLNEPGRRSDLTGMTALPVNEWSHVAGTFDGKELRVFVNGIKDGIAPAMASPGSGAAQLHIGRDYGDNAFQGNIDDVRIYSGVLSDAVILSLARGGSGPK